MLTREQAILELEQEIKELTETIKRVTKAVSTSVDGHSLANQRLETLTNYRSALIHEWRSLHIGSSIIPVNIGYGQSSGSGGGSSTGDTTTETPLNPSTPVNPPTPTHTEYRSAISESTTITEAEVLGGNYATTNTLRVPIFTSPPKRYLYFGVRDDEPDLTAFHSGGFDQTGSYVRVAGTIEINSVEWKFWRTATSQNDLVANTQWILG